MSSSDPYTNFRFTVEINSVIAGGFSEVTGLERTLETEDYREGGVNGYTHSFPDRMTHPTLTLKRGLTDAATFLDWIQSIEHEKVRRENVIILLEDSTGSRVWGWEAAEAYPVAWTGPELRADRGSVAFETIELTHRGLSKAEGLPR